MPLPPPNLDDRHFQDLVDEAKRHVQQRCPEWSDHNVSDPGVTLIETFAHMVDQLMYRLNQVPRLHYLRFLDLIGVRLFPPTAARADVTFWLSAAQENEVLVPAGTQVASVRSEVEEAVVFTTEDDLAILPCSLTRLATQTGAGAPADRTGDLRTGAGVACFGTPPRPGDAVYFGLSAAVPAGAVLLRLECATEGVGVDPRDPPWAWEAWDGTTWAPCEVDRDTTGGFNKPGDIVVHLPAGHAASLLGRDRAGWLRCRMTEPVPGRPTYSAPPRISRATAATIGATVTAVHADIVTDEVVGTSDGVAGQRFPLGRQPVVAADEPLTVAVSSTRGWEEWREVSTFADSGPGDRHVLLDRAAGSLVFGPAIREPDGTVRHYGAVPERGAVIRIPEYRTGGGRRGNVARHQLQVLRDPVPFVSTVANRRAASGGVDGESVDNAESRGPLVLRTRERAVTAEDYEQLAREAAPEIARVRCVPVEGESAVRVLVVPAVADPATMAFADLMPGPAVLARIGEFLDERRCVGARISVEPPFYQGVTVVAQLQAQPRTSLDGLRDLATQALMSYLDPIRGGPGGGGWPFGRAVHTGEIYAVLQRLPGVDLVEDVRLFAADPTSGERGGAVPRLELAPNALVFSYAHQVRVTRG